MFNLFDFIFPPKCLNCQKEGTFFCEICFQKILPKEIQQCPICKLKINHGEVCLKCKSKTPLSGLVVCTSYAQSPLLRKIINQFKYKYNEDLKAKLGEILWSHTGLTRILKLNSSTNPLYPPFQGGLYQQTPDSLILVPVPLHFRRQWQRGFNQAELLAKEIKQNKNFCIKNLLKRVRNTPQQAKLNRQERLQNLKGAFAIDQKEVQKLKKCHSKPVEEYKIILIDDIASTLSTLEECARTLKKAGFKNIWGLVIARG